MKEAFLDFLDEPKNSSRRLKEGIYESYTITLGKESEISLTKF